MKLTDFLQDVGRPVAYYPGLRKMTGSTTATILLCQLFYWTGKEAAGDGWIFKSSEELTNETGLSYDEQVTARKHLVERGLIEERYARLEHKMYFRICIETINALWEIPETGNAKMGNTESRLSLNGTTEITTEIEKEKEITQAEVFKFYQNNIELLTQYSSMILGDLIDSFTAEWVLEALKDCVEYNARNIKYAKKILEGWKANGFRSDTRSKEKSQKGSQNVRPQRNAAPNSGISLEVTPELEELGRRILAQRAAQNASV